MGKRETYQGSDKKTWVQKRRKKGENNGDGGGVIWKGERE